MTQSQLDRSVARRTGESLRLIRQRGFLLVPMHGLGKKARRARTSQAALDADSCQASITKQPA